MPEALTKVDFISRDVIGEGRQDGVSHLPGPLPAVSHV